MTSCQLFCYNSHVPYYLSCHLMSPLIKDTQQKQQQIKLFANCFSLSTTKSSFLLLGDVYFFFQIWFPPSLNLSCHLLSPPIRPPIHPIVNSCPSLKRTSTSEQLIVSGIYRMPRYRTFLYIEQYIVSNLPYRVSRYSQNQ